MGSGTSILAKPKRQEETTPRPDEKNEVKPAPSPKDAAKPPLRPKEKEAATPNLSPEQEKAGTPTPSPAKEKTGKPERKLFTEQVNMDALIERIMLEQRDRTTPSSGGQNWKGMSGQEAKSHGT